MWETLLVFGSCGATLELVPGWCQAHFEDPRVDLLRTADPQQRSRSLPEGFRSGYAIPAETFRPDRMGEARETLRKRAYDATVVLQADVNQTGYGNVIRTALTLRPDRILLLDRRLRTRQLHPGYLRWCLLLDPVLSVASHLARGVFVGGLTLCHRARAFLRRFP